MIEGSTEPTIIPVMPEDCSYAAATGFMMVDSVNRTVRFSGATEYKVHMSYKGGDDCTENNRDVVERIKTRIAITHEVGLLDNIEGKLKLCSGNEIPIAFG